MCLQGFKSNQGRISLVCLSYQPVVALNVCVLMHMWTGSCVCMREDSRRTADGVLEAKCGRSVSGGEEGGGRKRMKFQIPLTVLDSWPGMHTSPGLG